MGKNLSILLLILAIVALPFVFRQEPPATGWRAGDPVIVIVTPHNEGIRYEFARGFSRWHEKRYGRPVKVEWRAPGGTTEIMRFLASEYASAARPWWTRTLQHPWPDGGAEVMTASSEPANPEQAALWRAFRATDDPDAFSCRIDLFFGGGEFDHSSAHRQGLTVAPWERGQAPAGLFESAAGVQFMPEPSYQWGNVVPRFRVNFIDKVPLIPQRLGGETWRTPTLFGNAVSAFGICYNVDRLADLRVTTPPASWDDLADPVYFHQVGAADPSKSGSVAKAFEMMVHQKIHQAVRAAGFSADEVTKYEAAIAAFMKEKGKGYRRGEIPPQVPPAYQQAVERGWEDGIALVQLIGANARYFTDYSPRVPIDVSVGDAAVGMTIDFFGRYQSQLSAAPDGSLRMIYVTPVGGSSLSCDPISLLRGAGGHADDADPARRKQKRQETRQIAVRFIEFVLSEEGQQLWTYRPGEPGGPEKYALRRLPIRRDFYPSTNPAIQAKHLEHLKHAADNLADPTVDPYKLAETFTYWPRWTGSHFGIQRDMVRVMCMDAGDELQSAWRAIKDHGGPANNAQAMRQLRELPRVTLRSRGTGQPREVRIDWRNAPDFGKEFDRLEYTKEWTIFYRNNYRAVRQMAEGK